MKIRVYLKKVISAILISSMLMGNVVSVLAEEQSTESASSSSNSENPDNVADSTFDINPSESGANGRVNVFIRTAAGKNINDDVDSLEGMTQDDARFLGVYISNFFVPFGTELGSNTSVTEDNKKDIKAALQANLNFSDAMAGSFADTILGLSRSNNKELVLCVSNEYQKELIPVEGIDLSYYTAFQTLSGRLPELIVQHEEDYCAYALGGYSSDEISEKLNLQPESEVDASGNVTTSGVSVKYNPEVLAKIVCYSNPYDILSKAKAGVGGTKYTKGTQYYKYAYFAYKDSSGEYIPVFDMSLYGDFMTPSMVAFFKCLESVEFEKGYGTNILDFSKNEMSATNSGSREVLTTVENGKDLYEMSMYGMKLRVDCFGNLICMGANHQYIMVPACMNPYVWQPVDESGNDITAQPAGSLYNLINIPSMNLYDNDRLFSGASDFTTDGVILAKKGSVETKKLANRLYKIYYSGKIDGAEIAKSDAFLTNRVLRGSSETKINKAGVLASSDDTLKLLQEITNAAKEAGNTFFYKIKNSKLLCFNWEVTSSLEMMAPKISNNSFSCATNAVPFLNGMVFIDNLQAFGFNKNNTEDIKWETFNGASYVGNDSAKGSWKSVDTGFKNKFSSIKEGAMEVVKPENAAATVTVYVTYAYAGLYDADTKSDTIGKIGYRMFFDNLPEVSESPLSISDEAKEDIMSTSIKQWLYYLLHPTEGMNYTTILFTNKINAFLLNWHNSMLGTKGVGVVTGTTKYRGNIGYVTTPDLSELEWTDKLINWYESAIPFLIIFMVVVFVFVYMTKTLSLQKCILGVIVFAFCAMLPVPLINNVIGLSNRIVSNIYGERFTYWAMVQHETYTTAIDEAATGDNYGNYLRTLYNENSKININQGGESVMLKWQAPKKMSSLMLSSSDTSILNSFRQSFIVGAVNNAYSGESYLANDDATFLYRSYIDIANFSRYIYRGISENVRKSYNGNSYDSSIMFSNFPSDIQRLFDKRSVTSKYSKDRSNGYTNMHTSGGSSIFVSEKVEGIHAIVPLLSGIYNSAMSGLDNVSELTIDDYVGLNQDFFNFSIPMFNVENMKIKNELADSAKSESFDKVLSNFKEEDLTSLAAYGLYSENVFYYFSWLLYDCGLSTDSSANTGYKNLLLGKDNAGFFYNSEGNGELKDFMDMKTLFTYVIPYLNTGNRIVRQWDDVYGIKIYGGVSTEEGHLEEYSSDPELRQKYWHNLNVARLYNIYTPWVDLMYECSYAEPEYIEALGERYLIEDPINPSSYPDVRPMVFSRSEMEDYGLNESHLTRVEKLIISCNDKMEERMFELLNYHNFNDIVLNTAAAMNCAFIFNETFSETSLVGNNINIYPQTLELSDFSYDAFLRFILANSTGESMVATGDFYANIVNGSSMTTIIVMIILDVISVYLLPGVKIIFVVLIFLSAILVLLVSIFRIDESQRFFSRLFVSLFKPMIFFFLISVGMAYIISLFMGVGNNSVTQTNTASIQLGDPVMVMFAMLIIDIVAIVLYYRVVSGVWRSVKGMFKSLGGFGVGLVMTTGGAITGGLSVVRSAFRGGNTSSGGNANSQDMGIPSNRAVTRSNSNVQDKEVHHYMYVSPENWSENSRDLQRDVADLKAAREIYGKNVEVRDEYDKDKKYDINNLISQGMKKVDGLDDTDYYERELEKRQKEYKSKGSLRYVKEERISNVSNSSDKEGIRDGVRKSMNNRSNSVNSK